MSRILAIDPGNTESGWCLIDADCQPVEVAKTSNDEVLDLLRRGDVVAGVAVDGHGSDAVAPPRREPSLPEGLAGEV